MSRSVRCYQRCWYCAVLWLSACFSQPALALTDVASAHQWQPCELTFTATVDPDDPFDADRNDFHVVFTGPQGVQINIPGFWDGERTWKIRVTPTIPGVWTYRSSFTGGQAQGLDGQQGRVVVQPPTEEHAIRRHGGFLKVSANHRYLTYSDGTPFFWLGDTWWNCPSANVPLEHFQAMVDLRVKQGYTVFQAHGHRAIVADGPDVFQAVRASTPEALRYWREVDKYFAYAEEKGLLGAIGFAGHSLLDPFSLEDLKRLWRYYVARYGAYPITFLITQEYNANIGKLTERLPKMLALGEFIHQLDPYQRAMSVHPWCLSRDKREAWNEPWYDFIMLQAGHRWFPAAKRYHDIYQGSIVKPLLESEANYEGFEGKDFRVDAAAVRRTAYTAIQAGGFGFTYGAQGLYAGILSKDQPLTTARWGPVLTWKEAMSLPGGAQMQHLRACYESVEWWRLEPRVGAVPGSNILVKADRDQTFLLYFIGSGKRKADSRLVQIPAGTRFAATWFDPRTGQQTVLSDGLVADEQGLALPERPDMQDWMLVLKRTY